MLYHVQLCGPVKSWKRAQDPSNGRPKGFGFCEFESAEGILCATRLLNKLSIDGQELVVCVTSFLCCYFVEKQQMLASIYAPLERYSI
jgi:RNA recognition motif-containing protein